MDPMTAPPQCMGTVKTIFTEGTHAAAEALETMLGTSISFQARRMEYVPYDEIYSGRFRADSPLAMVVVRIIEDEFSGFVSLMMYEESARTLNSMLWGGLAPNEGVISLDNISALKEMGNVVCSSFLNALADATDTRIRASEPIFLYDMLAAVMETLLIEQGIVDTDQIMLIETEMSSDHSNVDLEFLFLPSPELTATLMRQVNNE